MLFARREITAYPVLVPPITLGMLELHVIQLHQNQLMLWLAAVAMANVPNMQLAWMAHVEILVLTTILVHQTHFAKLYSILQNVLVPLVISETHKLSADCHHLNQSLLDANQTMSAHLIKLAIIQLVSIPVIVVSTLYVKLSTINLYAIVLLDILEIQK
jgi:hypothetical protein